jgi:hypothetical protein
MTLQGKGFFTLNLLECEGGEPTSILAEAQAAGLSHVIVKIADGVNAVGFDASGRDFTAPVVNALRDSGFAVWGWQSVYGADPALEADIAIVRAQALRLEGYVVNVGAEYQRPGRASAAGEFMRAVRNGLAVPIALSSYRFPNYHPELPWSTFLEFCDLHMPQVTWEEAHNAGAQLRESKRQCDALPNARPYVPTGPAYGISGWSPLENEINEFLNTARELGLPAVNFFNWDTCRQKLPLVWKEIASFAWSTPAPIKQRAAAPIPVPDTPPIAPLDGFLVQFLDALNSRQAAQVTALYDPAATQVWADQLHQDGAAIQNGYEAFFASLPPGSIFTISKVQLKDNQRLFSWKSGEISGETSLVLKSGKIILEHTFINPVTRAVGD